MTHDTDTALFDVAEMSSDAPKTGARGPAKRRKAVSEAPATPSGETAQHIISEWIAFCQNGSGVPVPATIIGRMGKQVKQLIVSGYTTNQIKSGLTVWTTRWMDNPSLSPTQLETLTWHLCMSASREGARFQSELKRAVATLGGNTAAVTGPPSTAQERRDMENAQGQSGWRERLAENKRQREEMGL